MPDIDISKIEVGDELDLRVKVKGVERPGCNDKLVILVSDGAGSWSWIGLDIITAHHPKPKPLAVGDRVQRDYGGSTGTLLAVDGKDAWVRWPTGCSTTTIDHLERVS